MPQPVLTLADVDTLFRQSENQPTFYQGRDQNPDGTAHSLARHYVITNAGLLDRRDNEARDGAIAFFSAFATRNDMNAAGLEVLNSPAGLWAREQLFEQAATPQRARGSHTGMRAVIEHQSARAYVVRYAGGTGTMPANSFRMLLDRIDVRYLKLHIHTFFPTLGMRPQPSTVEVKYFDGRLFARWP